MIEKLKLEAFYEIKSIDQRTGQVMSNVKYNILCQGFYDAMFSFLNYAESTPNADSLNITYFALGDGTSPALRTNINLENEVFRKAPATITVSPNEIKVKLVISPAEGNTTGEVVREVGLFSGGTIALDSGVLLSRALVDIPKNSNIQLIITWTLQI